MTDILLSIIIPTYNRKDSIGRSLDSVIQQANKQVEVIVVDDGSTDGTETYIEQQYPSVRYFYQENAGVCAARNQGANMANGQFLYFLDSDDEASKGIVEEFLKHIKLNSDELILCNIEYYNSNHEFIKTSKVSDFKFQWLTGGFVISKRLFNGIGQYDQKLTYSENSDLFIRLSQYYGFDKNVGLIDKTGLRYNKEDRVSRNKRHIGNKYNSLKYFISKHNDILSRNNNLYLTCYTLLAEIAYKAGNRVEALKCIIKVLLKDAFKIKNYVRLFTYLLPRTVTMYLKGERY